MDAIADKNFKTEKLKHSSASDESPSLLTIIFDISAESWSKVSDQFSLQKVLESLSIGINSHLALNNSNRVAIIASSGDGARFLYPDVKADEQPFKKRRTSRSGKHDDVEAIQVDDSELNSRSATPEEQAENGANGHKSRFVGDHMYRQFKIVDETFLSNLYDLLKEQLEQDIKQPKNHISSALSLALSYTNKVQLFNPQYKARILCVNLSADEHLQYIQIMNSIFAAQKMKINIDVCQLASNSTFLQQAADSTNGVYLNVSNQDGLVQYLTTALGIDPSLRSILVKPNVGDIDFRASCFLTGKVVDVGYVCSVCLCILSLIPGDEKCPACESTFDSQVVMKLKRKPVVVRKGGQKKKRKLADGSAVSTPVSTPAPSTS
jgi:transcription initiation factor TFIIH subunit 3